MPGKSHRKRGKHSARSKKRRDTLAQVAPQQPVKETYRPVTVAAPPPVRQAPRETPAVRYPYVASELRRIGILAGVMLVILIVLSLLLP